jgi:hypothetical protein
MKTITFSGAIVLLLFTATAQRVDASGPTVWTTDGVLICIAEDNQEKPQLVEDGIGGAIITWQNEYSPGDHDIWAQRVNAAGDLVWDIGGEVICYALYDQVGPQIIGDGFEGAIITWQDKRNNNQWDIYAQRINADGDTVWTADGVAICTDTSNQYEPKLVADGFGGAIITWMDYRSGSEYDIYAQRINADGDTLWPADGVAICTDADNQYYPQLVGDGSGGAIITWEHYQSASSFDIFAQRIDANGDTLWPADGVAICTYSGEQHDPQLVGDGSGGAIITWEDRRNGIYYDIYAQRVGANGNVLWTADGKPVYTDAYEQINPQLVADGSGGAIITWQDERSTTDIDIYAQRITEVGELAWAHQGVAICSTVGYQTLPQLVADGSGGAIIAWEDERSGSQDDIYVQRIDANGDTIKPVDGEPICTAENNQWYPQLIADGSGGAIITWEDRRSTSHSDIYAQRIKSPAPWIVSVSDVPQDQGRQVAVMWDRSYLDDLKYRMITDYSIWRKFSVGSKRESIGQEWDGSLPNDRTQRVYRRIEREDASGQGKMDYWEFMGTVDANFFEGYTYIAPTLYDSSASGASYFSFIVSAHTDNPYVLWTSAPDSGYSVDNVNPAKTQVIAIAAGGAKGSVNTVLLSWDQVTTGVDGSPENGPIQYRIYYTEDPNFTPGPGNLLTSISGLSYAHTDSRIGDPAANLFYLVTVTDGSDNESAVSNVVGEFDKALTKVK